MNLLLHSYSRSFVGKNKSIGWKGLLIKMLFLGIFSFLSTNFVAAETGSPTYDICDDVTDAGTISGDETGCDDPIFDPSIILSASPATGGSGALQYLWMSTTDNPSSGTSVWTVIPGSSGESYDPGPITETTYYRRCAQRVGCTLWVNESNPIVKTVQCPSPCDLEIKNIVGVNPMCNPGNTGIVALSIMGGTAPITYIWSNGDTTEDITNLAAGTYCVTVTDANGCTATDCATITAPDPINPSTQITQTTCGDANGAIDLSVTGGTAPYMYAWNNGATTQDLSNLAAGTYCVIITDSKGCDLNACYAVNPSNSNTVTINPNPSTLCPGESITLVANANPSSTYTWTASAGMLSSNTGSTVSYSNSVSGSYTITVQAIDANGCVANISTTVTVSSPIFISGMPSPATCGASNGSVIASATGGTAPYTYAWNTGATTADLNNLVAGTYCITVTDANGCTESACFNVDEIGAMPVSLSPSQTSICLGESVSFTASGNGLVSYGWTATGGSLSSTTGPNNTFTATIPGAYTVTVQSTDTNGCISMASAVVIVNPIPVISGTPTPTTCGANNGTITINVSNSTTANTYLWNSGQTTATISNLAPGTFCVTVTNASGCSDTACFTIEAIPTIPVSVSPTQSTVCPFELVTLTANGDAGTTYVWTATAGNLSSTTGQSVTYSSDISGTSTITVQATDINGCISNATATVIVNNPVMISGTPNPATCGNANGFITTSVSGGTLPYTYIWSNGVTTADLADLVAGQYCVTVTDANGCVSSECFFVEEIGATPVSISGPSALCPGESITLTASGDGSSTYFWTASAGMLSSSTGQSVDYTMSMPGTYTITVQAIDINGCVATDEVLITVYSSPEITGTTTPATCGNDNGAIALVVTSGAAPYTYVWSTGSTTINLNDLAPGQYCVTVTDANGCMSSACFDVQEIIPVPVTISGPNSVCPGETITLMASGNITNTFLWSSNGGTLSSTSGQSITFSGDTPGIFIVGLQATDENGCISSATAIVNVLNAPVITGTVTDATCGAANGSIFTNTTNGIPPFTYIWSNGATTTNLNDIAAGQYCVTVTDANGCSSSECFDVEELGATPVTISGPSAFCAGESITLMATSDPASTYVWAATGGMLSSTTGPTVDYTVATPGTFTVIVEATNAIGCVSSASSTITVHAIPEITGTTTPATCGNNNGAIVTMVTTGTMPFTYAWSNGATTANLDNLAAGQFCVTVNDANGCTGTECFDIQEFGASPVTISGPTALCPGESITLMANSDPASAYVWSASAGTLSSTTGQTVDYTMGMPGDDTITVEATNAVGCVSTASTIVTVNTAPIITGTPTPATCGNANGVIAIVVTSGTLPYTYAWSNGAITANINNLAAGQYCVTVTDANGCTGTACFDVQELGATPVTISGPTALCPGESITLMANSDPASTYVWSASAGTLSSTTGQTVDYTMGMPGNYTITVEATNPIGCVSTTSVIVTVNTAPEITGTTTPATCGNNNGAIVTTVTSGTMPFTYAWSNGATTANLDNLAAGQFCVTVTDANGCTDTECFDIQEFGASPVTISGPTTLCPGESITLMANSDPASTYVWSASAGTLSSTTGQSVDYTMGMPGDYTITVEATNAIGCVSTASTIVTVFTAPTITGTASPATCGNANGSIAIVVTSGTLPYTYAWSNGAITANINNLAAGQYCVTITDANGCTGTACFDVQDIGATPVTISGPTALCPGESITLMANSDPASTYVWSASAGTLSSTTGQTVDYTMGMPGDYTISVEATNAVGCVSTASTIVTVNTAPTITGTTTPATCDNADGTVDIVVTSGTTPYTYAWSNGAITANINNLIAGQYCVTVTDVNGCTASECFNVENLGVSLVTISGPTALCPGESITLMANSDPASTYVWSASAGTLSSTTGQSVDYTMAMPGDYIITVEATNAIGCVSMTSTTVTVNTAPLITGTPTPATCGNANGAIAIVVTSGTLPYTYAWSNGAITANINNLAAGQYCVTVTDANGCTGTACFDVQEIIPVPVTISGPNSVCPGETITLMASGNITNTFLWSSNGGTLSSTSGQSITFSGDTPGIFIVNIQSTDENGCISSATAIVNVLNAPIITGTVTDATCGTANGSIFTNTTNGIPPFTYIWSNGATTANLNDIAAGQYCVTVTDANGCTASECFNVENLGASPVTISGPTALCPGESITLMANSDPASTYVWSASVGTLSSTTGQSVDYTMAMPGDYIITVEATNAIGCVSMASTTVTVNTPPTITGTATPTTCGEDNGAIATSIASGTTPFIYAWSNGAVTANINDLAIGQYCVTVTDANGCTATACFDVLEIVPEQVSIAGAVSVCVGQPLVLTGSGAIISTYTWSSNAGTLSTTSGPTTSFSSDTPGTFTISLQASDINNCPSTATTNVTVLAAPTITGTVNNATCDGANGSIITSVSNGLAPFTYIWSNGATTANLNNIAAGQFCVTITDFNGCTGTACFDVENLGVSPVTISGPTALCPGESITLMANSDPASTYVWSASAGTLSSTTGQTVDYTMSMPGDYTITVEATNDIGCVSTTSTTVTVYTAPVITGTPTATTCGDDNGAVAIVVTSGATPYTYVWSNGAITANINNLAAGQYCVTVTDTNGCTETECFDVLGSTGIVVSLAVTPIVCNGDSDGSITATVTGGTTPFTYIWNNGATTPTISNLVAGTYCVTVTDANGCTDVSCADIAEPSIVDITATANNTTCNEDNGSATVSSTTNIGSILWSNGATTATIVNLAPGTYTVTITNTVGCTATASVVVNPSVDITVNVNPPNTIVCPGEVVVLSGTSNQATGVSYTYTATGGTLSSTNTSTTTFSTTIPGTYIISLDVVNTDGCTDTDQATITVLNANSPTCNPNGGTVNIGNFVWFDINNNGIQDPGELGIGGIEVKLMTAGPDGIFYTADDITVDQTITDPAGLYLFSNVPPNDYVIMFCLNLPGTEYTTLDTGGNDEIDSDANPATGKTDPFTVTMDQDDDLSFDAGIILTPSGCDNITDGGEICCDQVICGAGGPVDPITNVTLPSGGSGAIEYIWMSSTVGGPFSTNTFSEIPGATGPTYDPGIVTQTIFLARCARRAGCTIYKESNIITLEVKPSPATTINSLPSFICLGETDDFNAAEAGIGVTYEWGLGEGATPATATGRFITGASWSTTGYKTVTLTTTNATCSVTITASIFVGSCTNPLTVNRFISLEASHLPETTEVDLQWQTREDMNDYIFLVEHSADGVNYDVLYTMDGADAFESKSYGYLDENARPGRNFYRIQHINNNGRTDKSEIAMVMIDDFAFNRFIVFPNPTQDFVIFESLKLTDEEGHIMISDMSGKILQEIVIPANTTRQSVDISSYPPGNYVFYIRYDSVMSFPRMINKMEK